MYRRDGGREDEKRPTKINRGYYSPTQTLGVEIRNRDTCIM